MSASCNAANYIHGATVNDFFPADVIITSSCPLVCRCGCRDSEICGEDGRCYCPDGSLVIPLVDVNGTLVGHNQTCPESTAKADTVMTTNCMNKVQ